jgi:vacuolar-type H+-ATPase subunit I/STV1
MMTNGDWFTLAGMLAASVAAVGGIVIWVMRRGPDDAIKAIRNDVDGIGKKVDEQGREHEADRALVGALRVQMGQSAQERQELRERVVKCEANVENLQKQIVGQQRDIMEAIHASSMAQLSAVSETKVEIAKLGERANIADCMVSLGLNLERVVKMAIERDMRSEQQRGSR